MTPPSGKIVVLESEENKQVWNKIVRLLLARALVSSSGNIRELIAPVTRIQPTPDSVKLSETIHSIRKIAPDKTNVSKFFYDSHSRALVRLDQESWMSQSWGAYKYFAMYLLLRVIIGVVKCLWLLLAGMYEQFAIAEGKDLVKNSNFVTLNMTLESIETSASSIDILGAESQFFVA